jgi:hypothetical protein
VFAGIETQSDCCVECDNVQHIYCKNTVQTVQYTTELYNNYTDAADTCSAAHQHSKFTVQILYKLYSLQLNCTYSNYTEAAGTFSAAQQERICRADVS